VGKPKDAERAKRGTKLARGANFECLMSGTPIAGDYIKAEGQAGRMGARLMAIVAEGERGRVYLAPTPEHEAAARQAQPAWKPDVAMPDNPRWFSPPLYGLTTYGDLFTPRQLVALTAFSDLVGEAIEQVRRDALAAGLPDDPTPLRDGGTGAAAYAEAVGVYLGIGVSRLADAQNSLCQWGPGMDQTQHLFRRQAIPMVWDYSESSVFSGAAGDLLTTLTTIARVIDHFGSHAPGVSAQADAQSQNVSNGKVVSTDPPYCLVPGTLILTPEGYVPIETIQVGDRVLTHRGRFARVTRTYARHFDGLLTEIKVAHTNEVLRITPEHPVQAIRTGDCRIGYADYCHAHCAWQAQNNGRCSVRVADAYHLDWIEAGDLRKNDLLFLPTLVPQDSPEVLDLGQWLSADEYLLDGERLHYQKATARSLSARAAVAALPRQYAQPVMLPVSAELCRLLGYFVAEGYAHVCHDGGTICFTLSYR